MDMCIAKFSGAPVLDVTMRSSVDGVTASSTMRDVLAKLRHDYIRKFEEAQVTQSWLCAITI